MARRQLILRWADERGQHATAFYETQSNPAPVLSAPELAWIAAMAAASSCRLEAVREFREYAPGIAPASGPYDRVDDRLLVTGKSTEGAPLRLVVPGMITATLKPDLENGDLESVLLAAVASSAMAVLADGSGAAMSQVERAVRYGVRIGRTGKS